MTLWPQDYEPSQQERDAALDLINEKIQAAEYTILRALGDVVRPGCLEISPGTYLGFDTSINSLWRLNLDFRQQKTGKKLLTSAPRTWRLAAVQHLDKLLLVLKDKAREEVRAIEGAVSSLDSFNSKGLK